MSAAPKVTIGNRTGCFVALPKGRKCYADDTERQATRGFFPCGLPDLLCCVLPVTLTLNQRVAGSSPAAPTIIVNNLAETEPEPIGHGLRPFAGLIAFRFFLIASSASLTAQLK